MKSQRQAGFTLLELMVTITVAAVILGFGVPSFITLVQNNRMTAAANDLVAALTIARTEAVKRATPVTVCASNNPQAPLPTCAATAMNGWVVFADSNDTDADGQPDGNIVIEAGEVILQTHAALPATFTPNANGVYASFAANGFSRTVGAVGPSLTTALFCDERGNQVTGTDQAGNNISAARVITLAPTGRAQVLRTTNDVATALGVPGLAPGNCP